MCYHVIECYFILSLKLSDYMMTNINLYLFMYLKWVYIVLLINDYTIMTEQCAWWEIILH